MKKRISGSHICRLLSEMCITGSVSSKLLTSSMELSTHTSFLAPFQHIQGQYELWRVPSVILGSIQMHLSLSIWLVQNAGSTTLWHNCKSSSLQNAELNSVMESCTRKWEIPREGDNETHTWLSSTPPSFTPYVTSSCTQALLSRFVIVTMMLRDATTALILWWMICLMVRHGMTCIQTQYVKLETRGPFVISLQGI